MISEDDPLALGACVAALLGFESCGDCGIEHDAPPLFATDPTQQDALMRWILAQGQLEVAMFFQDGKWTAMSTSTPSQHCPLGEENPEHQGEGPTISMALCKLVMAIGRHAATTGQPLVTASDSNRNSTRHQRSQWGFSPDFEAPRRCEAVHVIDGRGYQCRMRAGHYCEHLADGQAGAPLSWPQAIEATQPLYPQQLPPGRTFFNPDHLRDRPGPRH